jgi:putative hemolysin
MKNILLFTLILMALTACTTNPIQKPESIATEIPQAGLPNPAAVFCTQNGFNYEIQSAADGSQSGICSFPDGSICDDWAYFKGECGPEKQEDPTTDTNFKASTEASGGGPGGGNNAGEHASGGNMAPGTTESFSDWWGVIKSTESGAQYNDYFERQDLEQQFIYFGIDSLDPAVIAQIEELRDSGKVVHLYGTLFSNVADFNGSQVQVDRIEVEG